MIARHRSWRSVFNGMSSFMNYAMLRLGYVIEMSDLDTLRDALRRYARSLTGFDRYTTML